MIWNIGLWNRRNCVSDEARHTLFADKKRGTPQGCLESHLQNFSEIDLVRRRRARGARGAITTTAHNSCGRHDPSHTNTETSQANSSDNRKRQTGSRTCSPSGANRSSRTRTTCSTTCSSGSSRGGRCCPCCASSTTSSLSGCASCRQAEAGREKNECKFRHRGLTIVKSGSLKQETLFRI
ncbi:hypothetical protein LX82_02659 [Celeribacter halophilus]|uniref:Uncharacterized protein n=1 Tax=Celeribacter halophilus TaxID=576117 RepID=A0A1I3WH47_9RHOB|nr:hypothetical protein LX82_02659 [Celeribacter halophilus]SFK06878.1 hypothetical protein SAMN04488138_12521 [Celeribacter halophilus]